MSNNPISSSSVFAVSGGARGITAKCVIRMAEEFHCKFILLGRSSIADPEPAWAAGIKDEAGLKKQYIAELTAAGEKPTPVKVSRGLNAILARREIEHTLAAIVEAGGQAVYLDVDITDGPVVAEKLAGAVQSLRPVTGLLHGAGNLADKLIEKKTLEDFESVYRAKVTGLQNLLAAVPVGQLDHLVLFSSVAGFFGNTGQADYAISNEILNKTAYLVKKQHPDCHVVSINWGPWDGGMVTPALKEFFARRHIEVIPVVEGTQILVNELSDSNREVVQVVVGSPITAVAEQLDPTLKTYRVRRKLKLENNPFLLDHIIGGNPVLPAICVIDWVANATEQLYPGFKMFISENNRVLKGVVFDGKQAEEYTLEIKEISKDLENGIIIDATIWSINDKGKIQYHYGAHQTLLRELPAPPRISFEKLVDENAVSGETCYRSGILFHGPSFQGVKNVLSITPQNVLLECYLPGVPEEVHGQFPVNSFNPYGVDVQLQCLLIWSRHFYEAASLPLKIQHVQQYRTTPFNKTYYARLEVQSSSDTGLVATVSAFDENGVLYNRITGAEVTISKKLNSLFVTAGEADKPSALTHA